MPLPPPPSLSFAATPSTPTGFRILTVCTGNMCRSPFAELYLAHRIPTVGGPGARDVLVESAGTRGVVGHEIAPEMAKLLALRGVTTAGGFRARYLDEWTAQGARLVLTATRAHRTQVLTLAPAKLKRTFTLAEFARLLEATDPGDISGEDWPARLESAIQAAVFARARFAGTDTSDDDIEDPIGQDMDVFDRVARRIVQCLDTVVEHTRPW